MALLDYTSYDEVRAVLGVSEKEITDATLALDVYQLNLSVELAALSEALEGDYATVSAVAANTRTALQTKFYGAVRLFSTYAVAFQLLAALPNFSPKDITDGKAAVGRYADSPYKVVIDRTSAMYDTFRVFLASAYKEMTTGSAIQTTVRSPLYKVGLAINPVTGA